jgi:choline kinase
VKAIVLCAGQGARMKPLTDHRPKCMVPYKGVPLIDRILTSLRAAGIDDIVLVKGYKAEALVRPGVRSFVNAEWETGNMVSTLFSVEDELEGDVLISYSDIAYSPDVVRALLATPGDIAIAVDDDWRALWSRRMPDPLADAETLIIDAFGAVREIGAKPRGYEDIHAQYMGLIKLTARGARALRDLYAGLDRSGSYDGQPYARMYMTSLLQRAIGAGLAVRAARVHGGWIEIDTPSDLLVDVALGPTA